MLMRSRGVTAAARIMLPTYPIVFGLFGVNLVLTPDGRLTETPAYHALEQVVPLTLFGFSILAAVLVQVVALAVERVEWELAGLALLAFLMVLMAVVSTVGAFYWHTSLGVGLFPLLAGVACFASGVSLSTGEQR